MKRRRLIKVKVDIISNLTVEALDAILVRLPLKDAVRTSILSRKWRDKWLTISELVFNDSYTHGDLDEDTTVKKLELVSHVDQVLLRHQGCLQKFMFCSRLPILSHLDRWIICLSRKGVKELIIDCGCGHYEVSSRIFRCQDIISLQLHHCFVKSPPPSLEVFPNLKNLGLYSSVMSTYDDHVQNISTLISKCPLLERLTFKPIFCTSIKINAPCLKFMDLSGQVMTVYFEYAPVLCEISIGEPDSSMKSTLSDGNFILSLCNLPYIRKLALGTKHSKLMLGSPHSFEPKTLTTALCNLENLSVCINFENYFEIVRLLSLLRSSSGLMKLSLQSLPIGANYHGANFELNCLMNNLLEVFITGLLGLASELEFIKELLANSPVLRKMTLKESSEKMIFTNSLKKVKILKELLQFKRASAAAEIIWIDYKDEREEE